MAILLSLICPGLGHLYTGRVIQGAMWFFLAVAGYCCFLIPGIFVHLFVIVDAARDQTRMTSRNMQRQADMMANAFARKR